MQAMVSQILEAVNHFLEIFFQRTAVHGAVTLRKNDASARIEGHEHSRTVEFVGFVFHDETMVT